MEFTLSVKPFMMLGFDIQYGLCYYCKKPGYTEDQCVEIQQNDASRGILKSLTGRSPNLGGRIFPVGLEKIIWCQSN